MPVPSTGAIKVKITLLAEGSTVRQWLMRRWGISFLVGEDILFDVFGNEDVFFQNVKYQKIDLSKVRHFVLSHDHWDHSAGLWKLLANYKNIDVYICPGFSQETKDKIAFYRVKVIEVKEPMGITDGVYSSGEICGVYKEKKIYEQALVVKSAEGLAVVCGCSHPGVSRIVRHVKERFQQDIYFVAGGFHLLESKKEDILKVVSELRDLGVKKVAPLHCTGAQAVKLMRKAFGIGFKQPKEGDIIDL